MVKVILEASAWNSVGETVRDTFEAALGRPFACGSEGAVIDHAETHASMSMLDAEREVEIVLMLSADCASGNAVARWMLGTTDTDTATVEEVLGELCNITLGMTKTSFHDHGFAFALGLARIGVATRDVEPSATRFDVSRAFVLRSGDVRVFATLGVRAAPSRKVTATELDEDMVLAVDVYTPQGEPLVRKGTRITRSVADRIVRVLPAAAFAICAYGRA